jgi:hypothetical protein
MTEQQLVIVVVEWEETPKSDERSHEPGHEHHRHEIHVVDERDGRTFLIHARDNTLVSTVVSKFFEKVELTRLPGDLLTCDSAEHHDVFQLEALTVGQFLASGHHLRWKFSRVEFHIIVNGRKKTVKKRELSFTEVVLLAFETPSENANTIYTVTYRNGVHSHPEGSLVFGEKVEVKDGMIFNVTPTDKS